MQTMSLNVPKKDKITKFTRIHQVIELKATGRTIDQIAQELGVSEKTVDRDLKSQPVTAFIDELIRQQVFDINSAVELETRLSFRSDLLEKLLPKRAEIKQDVQCTNTSETKQLLEIIAKVDKALSEGTDVSEDNTAKQIHTAPTNTEASAIPIT